MPAFRLGLGCGCCGPPPVATCQVCVSAIGCCGLGVAEGTVTIKDPSGTTLASGGLDADTGEFCADVPEGPITIAFTPASSRFATPADKALTLDCDAPPSTQTFTLEAAEGYVCGPCGIPLPATLTLNDGQSDITVTHDPAADVWSGDTLVSVSFKGCALRPVGAYNVGGTWRWNVFTLDGNGDCSEIVQSGTENPGPITVKACYELILGCAGTVGLAISSPSCKPDVGNCSVGFDPAQAGTSPPWDCSIFHVPQSDTATLNCGPLQGEITLGRNVGELIVGGFGSAGGCLYRAFDVITYSE